MSWNHFNSSYWSSIIGNVVSHFAFHIFHLIKFPLVCHVRIRRIKMMQCTSSFNQSKVEGKIILRKYYYESISYSISFYGFFQNNCFWNKTNNFAISKKDVFLNKYHLCDERTLSIVSRDRMSCWFFLSLIWRTG